MAGPDRKISFTLEQAAPLKEGEVADLQRPLQNVEGKLGEAIKRLNDTPWTTSRLTDPTTFTALQSVAINHRLGRIPVRWTFEDVTGGYGGFARISWDDKVIVIQAIFACTAVFRVE